MKAVFKYYSSIEPAFNFTKRKLYDVNVLNDGIISIIDDDGNHVVINNGTYYNFDIINDTEGKASFKYFINDIPVEKGFFYESIGELNEADRLGVKMSSVRFEIKFE